MNKEQVKDYLKDCLANLVSEESGCQYLSLGEYDLYLVACYDVDLEGVIVKIASNNSSLQCDYDNDWSSPVFTDDSDCAFVEILTQEKDIDSDADYLLKEFEQMQKLIKSGKVEVL